MTNILFDRQTLKATGASRPSLPFEVEIKNVVLEGLTKQVSYFEDTHKSSEDGELLYYLPQDHITEKSVKEIQVETTEETGDPVLVINIEKVPLLDEEGVHVQSEITTEIVIPAKYDEDGLLISEESTEIVGTGEYIKYHTNEEVLVHKTNGDGKELFYKKETVTEDIITEQPSLEITEDDENYTEGLSPVIIPVEKFRTVSYDVNPHEFTYEDILQHKYLNIIDNSQLDEIIVATFIGETIDESYEEHTGSVGFGFVNLLPNGKVKTIQYDLGSLKSKFTLLELDADDGIEIRYNNRPVTSTLSLASPIDKIEFFVVNKTDKPRNIRSFAIGY